MLHQDEARQLDTWGHGRMEIATHQHELAFKILLMLRISFGRMEGWQVLQECHLPKAKQLHTLLWDSERVEIATRQH